MSENRISYLTRTYPEYREELMRLTKKYYPDMMSDFQDASVGQWFIELFSSIADELSYHIDRNYQETSIDSAMERGSLLKIARTNGVRVPGKKAALVEIELSCNLPMVDEKTDAMPNMAYAPLIKRGTLFSTGSCVFELMADIDFNEQFDENGVSNRQIIPNRDANGNITGYTLKKLGVALAGQSKIYKRVIQDGDMVPFFKLTLSDSNLLGVESVIVKEGTDLTVDPTIDEFLVDEEEYADRTIVGGEKRTIKRFFEVESLIDQYRYGYEEQPNANGTYNPIWYKEIGYATDAEGKQSTDEVIFAQHLRGYWKRLKHKFITEYEDNEKLDLIFGAGLENREGDITTYDDSKEFTKYMMSRMLANDYMGVCPESGNTMFVLYRVGGGEMSNIAKDTLINISYLNGCFPHPDDVDPKIYNDLTNRVRKSLRVTNPTPSYGGKDAPSNEELRYLIKYSAGSQNRCVTLHDYAARIMELPPKYGTPFRVGVAEENNKVVIYALGLNSEGKLDKGLSEVVSDNILSYLEHYRMINDFVEMKSGKINNLAFEIDIFVEKSYDKAEVTKRVIDLVYDYMDIRKHQMGEDIFLGDLSKEISKLDGVLNLIELRCYDKCGKSGYSADCITQAKVNRDSCCYDNDEDADYESTQIDLKDSNMVLFSDVYSMFEVKYKEKDIRVRVKER